MNLDRLQMVVERMAHVIEKMEQRKPVEKDIKILKENVAKLREE